MSKAFDKSARELVDVGRYLFQQGMAPATSGNFSARLPDGNMAITVSGKHKGRLAVDDILLASPLGESLDGNKPSAETLLHVQIYQRFPGANCVLHPHSVNATLLSRLVDGELKLQDYEILKAFPGVVSHQSQVTVPVFANDQDITRLAIRVDDWMESYKGDVHGYLIAGHGFYTWGASVDDALRHVEAFEFLFECEMKLRGLKP